MMEKNRGYPAVAALQMARIQKRQAEKYNYADLALSAIKLERRAMEAIDAGVSFLPPVIGGEIILAPELSRQLAKLIRLHGGQPGYLDKMQAERIAANYELMARLREGRTLLAKAGGSITDHKSPSMIPE
jgi:hypothetical protein